MDTVRKAGRHFPEGCLGVTFPDDRQWRKRRRNGIYLQRRNVQTAEKYEVITDATKSQRKCVLYTMEK